MEGKSETIVRYTRLRPALRPVEIYLADTLEPIDPDWVAITHAFVPIEGRVDALEAFCMHFLTEIGEMLGHYQFDTLEIALDQAHAIAGIPLTDWRACHVERPEHDDLIPWSLIA